MGGIKVASFDADIIVPDIKQAFLDGCMAGIIEIDRLRARCIFRCSNGHATDRQAFTIDGREMQLIQGTGDGR